MTGGPRALVQIFHLPIDLVLRSKPTIKILGDVMVRMTTMVLAMVNVKARDGDGDHKRGKKILHRPQLWQRPDDLQDSQQTNEANGHHRRT